MLPPSHVCRARLSDDQRTLPLGPSFRSLGVLRLIFIKRENQAEAAETAITINTLSARNESYDSELPYPEACLNDGPGGPLSRSTFYSYSRDIKPKPLPAR